MAFQIKNFVSIVASMVNHMKGTQTELTDFAVGSVTRTIVEAPAIEIDEFYQQMVNGLTEAIPVATYRSFNFSKLDAVKASGIVVLSITAQSADVLIPATTVFSFSGGSTGYSSLADVTILAGNTTANVLCAAVTAGTVGNIAKDQSFTVAPLPNGFVSATNPRAFSNGSDAETADQMKQRFINYVSTLQRGTIAAIEYGLGTARVYDASGIQIEGVASAKVIEPYVLDITQPTGLVNAYIHNGVGSTTSDLVAAAQKIVDGYTDGSGNKVPGYKAAGVVVVVAAATEVPLNVTRTITTKTGYVHSDLVSQAASVITNYISSLEVGGTFTWAEVIELVMSIPGISNISLTPPMADVASTNSQKLIPGTVVIT